MLVWICLQGPQKNRSNPLGFPKCGFPIGKPLKNQTNLDKLRILCFYIYIYHIHISLYVCVLYITTKQVFGIVTPTDHHLFAKPGSPGPSQRARTAEAAGRVVGTSLRAPGTPIPRSTGLLAHPPTPKSLIS